MPSHNLPLAFMSDVHLGKSPIVVNISTVDMARSLELARYDGSVVVHANTNIRRYLAQFVSRNKISD